MRPTERFSSRAEDYARHRPGYPPAAIALLVEHCGLKPGAAVADVGSGTGLLTEALLAQGAQVFAIEPNDAMRSAADERLSGDSRFHSIKASAEETTLAAASIDLWVAGQAFHWFDVQAARREALRIARPGARGALLWNERPAEPGTFLSAYEALLRQFAPEYEGIVARRAEENSMRAFFGGNMQRATFANQQIFDFEGLRGRLMSSSYAPQEDHPCHQPMLQALRQLFARHQRNERVVFPYQTLVYYAQLRASD
jgi:ubiquinone/menaquinone biosynthesis C-methylase UbiE